MNQIISSQNSDERSGGDGDHANGNENIKQPPAAPIVQPPQHRFESKRCSGDCCRKKCSFDIGKAIELFIGLALVLVGFLQYRVYTRQAGIMDTQTRISGEQVALTKSIQRGFITVSELKQDQPINLSDPASPSRFTAIVKNSGTTPAIDATIIAVQPRDERDRRTKGI